MDGDAEKGNPNSAAFNAVKVKGLPRTGAAVSKGPRLKQPPAFTEPSETHARTRGATPQTCDDPRE